MKGMWEAGVCCSKSHWLHVSIACVWFCIYIIDHNMKDSWW